MTRIVAAILGAALVLSGCVGLGPSTISRDRFDYNAAVADSWKQQVLLNIVRLRYMDEPVFLDLAQIVSGYSFQSTVTGSAGHNTGAFAADTLGISAQGVYTDRPTITYTPMTGQAYMKGLLTPIAPSSVLFLIQAGYSTEAIMAMVVESINGLRNVTTAPARSHPGDPDYFRVVELFSRQQHSGAIGMRIEVDKAARETTVITFRKKDSGSGYDADAAEFRRLLRLDPDTTDFKVSSGMNGGGGNVIDVTTRSVLQVMIELSGSVEIPDVHRKEGSAMPVASGGADVLPLIRVHCGTSKPADPYVAVRYRGHWFWIDQGDLPSKRTLMFLIAIFNFADLGKADKLPLITIPAQ